MEITLKRFDPRSIPDNAICLFIGRRGSGKSTALKDVLYYKRHIPYGNVFSPTESSNQFFSSCIPSTFIYPDYDAGALDKMIKRQKKINRGKTENQRTPCFLVADDCMYDAKTIKRDVNVRQVFMNGRHLPILLLMTMQYAMDIDPGLRLNADYIFVFRDPIKKNRERLYDNFFGIFPTFDSFEKVFEACTNNFECLVLDNRSVTNNIEDCVFWYKAKERGNFRVGSNAFWQYHMIHFDPTAEERQEEIEAAEKNTKKGTKIIVKRV